MKKVFSFNKFFIAFCLLFVIVWIALQTVRHMRILDGAKADGEEILAWNWPEKNVRSMIKISDAKLLKNDHNEIIAKVSAFQRIQSYNYPVIMAPDHKCAVTLTYYRTNDKWFLGKVDCE